MLMWMNRKMRKNRKGFTLIELIVVIAILAILALIAIPRLFGFTETARQSNDKEAAAVVANAAAQYFALHEAELTSATSISALTLEAAGLISADDTKLISKGYGGASGLTIAGAAIINTSAGAVSVTLTPQTPSYGATAYTITK